MALPLYPSLRTRLGQHIWQCQGISTTGTNNAPSPLTIIKQ